MTEQEQQPTAADYGPDLNLNLNVAEINFLVSVLRKLPMEQTEGLVNKIRSQAQAGFAAHQQAQELAKETKE